VDDSNAANYLACPALVSGRTTSTIARATRHAWTAGLRMCRLQPAPVHHHSTFMWEGFRDARLDGSDIADMWNFRWTRERTWQGVSQARLRACGVLSLPAYPQIYVV
jgi:hypothetical protein